MKRGISFLLALLLLLSLLSCNRARTPGEGEILVEFLDVGQADCTVIRTASTTLLIDTGGPQSAGAVTKYLKRAGVTSIDCLVLTHGHSDHIGNAAAVLSATSVGYCLMPNDAPDTDLFRELLSALREEGCAVKEAYRGVTLTFGDVALEILSPDYYATEGENGKSVALRLLYKDNSFLFMGDCTLTEERQILSQYAPSALSAQVLRVGHHGSRYASGEELLLAVRPEIAVISCGAANSYGFPHAETIARLAGVGAVILRTDTDGTLTLLGNGREVTVLN